LQADGSFDVTYTLVTTNTGNVTLDNLTLVDDLATQFGAAFLSVVTQPVVTVQPSLAGAVDVAATDTVYAGGATPLIGATGTLPVGDSFTVTFTVNLDASASTALENSAQAGATPPVSDANPTPTAISDNSANDASQNTTDDSDPTTGEVANGTEDTSDPNDTNIATLVTPPVDEGGVTLVKSAILDTTVVGGAELNVGDQITYTFTVTNTSTVLNALNVSVAETLFTGTGTAPTPVSDNNGTTLDTTRTLNDLAPGAELTWSATYTLTQADIDAGKVDNQARVTAEDPFGNALTDVSDNDAAASGVDGADNSAGGDGSGNVTSLPLSAAPELALAKTLIEPIPGAFTPGQTLFYEFAVTNTGNASIPDTDTLTINDNRIDPATLTCPAIPVGGLPPIDPDGDGTPEALVEGVNLLTCTANYEIVADDVLIGSVTNVATANTAATGDSNIDDAIFPANAMPALAVEKTAISGANFSAVGDIITYQYVITNNGGAAFVEPITLTDDKDLIVATTENGDATGTVVAGGSSFVCWNATSADPAFDADPNFDVDTPTVQFVGQQATCTADYSVTQADLDAGQVDNVVLAQTTFGAGNLPVASSPADESV
ncbi:MAG: hypothetical protein ABJH99_00120, partial [Tateyamaria sp.]